jgi:hypothetical protein
VRPHASLPADHVRELNKLAYAGAYVDWDRLNGDIDQVRRFLKAASELTELEVLRPGPLLGNEALAWFQQHPRLRVLDLSPERHLDSYTHSVFYSAVDEQGLEVLAEGFPALEFLILRDGPRPWDDYPIPTRVYSPEALARLRAKRPSLTIVHQRSHHPQAIAEAWWHEQADPPAAATVQKLNGLECDLRIDAPTYAVAACLAKPPSEAVLRRIAEEPALAALDCGMTGLGDEQLARLAAARYLEFVSVSETWRRSPGCGGCSCSAPGPTNRAPRCYAADCRRRPSYTDDASPTTGRWKGNRSFATFPPGRRSGRRDISSPVSTWGEKCSERAGGR